MTAITSPVIKQLAPNAGLKEIVLVGAMENGETFDASAYFSTIISVYVCSAAGAVYVAAYSGTTVTLGAGCTGSCTLRILGF